MFTEIKMSTWQSQNTKVCIAEQMVTERFENTYCFKGRGRTVCKILGDVFSVFS